MKQKHDTIVFFHHPWLYHAQTHGAARPDEKTQKKQLCKSLVLDASLLDY